ncbi:cysteine-rich secretory protein LCCL domain-containing 2 isoform X1 [Rhagoletis pomonella]|uniref:cysteine-rich secretory protein LCCL domain-containing 2 isoform X1 n=1 Tax=Rhagoletis pomonella TaxID=28610 RepID=UPI00178444F7|nr:cysteine-rich secretory protein LCCL domain-containing 2 isoform X1 [Rhagoletis pomonella]
MEIMPQRYLLQAALVLVYCSVALACRGQLLVSGLSSGEREIILHEHNKLRQLVATGRYPGQPGAENMREIVWDDELAARAQQWADNCEFRHDPLRTINRFTMGQNLAIIWSTAPLDPTDGDFPSRIQSWFNEVQRYSFGDAWSPKTGHYSQLVWGETSLVGCGFSEYKDTTKYNKLYVCNYGPGGNVVGYKPYEEGKPSCATYGLRSSARYQGLCAPSVAPIVSANAIDTYEYKQNNNNKKTAYSTQSATTSTSSSSSSSVYSPKQATNTFGQRKTTSGTTSSTFGTTVYTTTNNGNKAYTTQTGDNKYKNKLEAYRPSTAEYQRAVQKHTLLRTYLNNPNLSEQQLQQEAQRQQQQQDGNGNVSAVSEVFVFDKTKQNKQQVANTTPQPAKRGWSLLTWRG